MSVLKFHKGSLGSSLASLTVELGRTDEEVEVEFCELGAGAAMVEKAREKRTRAAESLNAMTGVVVQLSLVALLYIYDRPSLDHMEASSFSTEKNESLLSRVGLEERLFYTP